MRKKLLTVAFAVLSILGMNAQLPQLTPLPLNSKVKSGKLPNGLSYYVMHNEEPKGRANFYIAQKVGSTLETPDQLGLAHFLEHMAFNGTTHYPGKSMLNYLQSKGIRFGADINAYTDFDETVYNINNVSTSDSPLMDSVLLVLRDWSCGILLEESEINAERGVIQEEWRSRNDANTRRWISILPKIYEEYQYRQMPIGSMDVVMNFKPEVLRAYYKKWYRPDQQGIVVVGDFDADAMEKKIREMFSTIPMPENAAERTYPTVSNNERPIYVNFTDPEIVQPLTMIAFKDDVIPFELRNTVEMYANVDLVKMIISSLLANRLSEHSLSPDCRYAACQAGFGNFFVSKTKSAFTIYVVPKKEMVPAVADAMAVISRAFKTGFSEEEYERVKAQITARYDNLYNEREKTTTASYGNELCRFFIDNEPAPGIEKERELLTLLFNKLNVSILNQMASSILTAENMVVVTSEPQKDGFEVASEETMLKTILDAMNAEYEAKVEEKITEPLIAALPAAGKIVSQTEDEKYGIQILTLSNGVKVVVKPTDFAADQIIMDAYRNGGQQIYGTDMTSNLKLVNYAISTAKKGPFDVNTMQKYLAGKRAGISLVMNNYTDEVVGSTTVKDLPTFMELLYVTFTDLKDDQVTFDAVTEKIRQQVENQEKNPDFHFSQTIYKTRFPENPALWPLTVADIESVDYAATMNMIRLMLANAAEYTFVFVGNIDMDTFKPLLEQYVATLPAGKVEDVNIVSPLKPMRGIKDIIFKQSMQTPKTSVFELYSDFNVPLTLKNAIMMNMIGDILQNIYTETLREEEGGTYGAGVSASLNYANGLWSILYQFDTNKEKQDVLMNRAVQELNNLLQNGASEENFNKVKSAMKAQHEIQVRRNNYWLQNLLELMKGHDNISDYDKTLDSIDLATLNTFMKTVNNGKNRMKVVMEGVQEIKK